jgi:hypothetical protein
MARSTDPLKPAENLAFPHKRLVSIATVPAITLHSWRDRGPGQQGKTSAVALQAQ